ncbi:hypothetical protein [Saccharopolyspora taberi]|uniref:Tat pathway signal protein n=1 Tax=Saccharopolyspora taberi TaxID=60895 RepID=A0ABN3V914_9PSEU
MESPSRTRHAFGRRAALRLFALAPVAAALTTACAPREAEPDVLLEVARAAKADAALAEAVGRAHAGLAEAAGEVATVRKAHAQALQQEIDRVNPPDPEAPPSVPEAPPAQAPSSSDQATEQLRAAARAAQQQAAALVPSLPPYRAGLAGSVSAGCACLLEVLS